VPDEFDELETTYADTLAAMAARLDAETDWEAVLAELYDRARRQPEGPGGVRVSACPCRSTRGCEFGSGGFHGISPGY
jgi:hypothetical protein